MDLIPQEMTNAETPRRTHHLNMLFRVIIFPSYAKHLEIVPTNTTATHIPYPPPYLPLERGEIGTTFMKLRKPHEIPSSSEGGLEWGWGS
jgi:hypothetical protein